MKLCRVGVGLLALLLVACTRAENHDSGASDVVGLGLCERREVSLHIVHSISKGDPNPLEHELFTRIEDIAIGADLKVYVLDSGDARVQVYDESGQFLFRFGGAGEGPGELRAPRALAIRGDHVYVLESSGEVHVFTSSGDYASTLRLPPPPALGRYNSMAIGTGDVFVLGLTYIWIEGNEPTPPLYGVALAGMSSQELLLTDTLRPVDLEVGGHRYIPIPRRVVATDADYVLAADHWQLPVEVLDQTGGHVWTFEGCLPFAPNGPERPRPRVPPGGLGGWDTTGGVSSLGEGRFARFLQYSDGTDTAPQMVEVINVPARTSSAIPLVPHPTRARRFTGAAFKDDIAVFFNRFHGELVWARLALEGG